MRLSITPGVGPAPCVCVCVPVRDEAARLPRLLRALAAQRDVGPGRWAACFVLDRCRDDSFAVIEAFARRASFPVHLETMAGDVAPNAGRARRAALALGRRLLGGRVDGVLLTTDADSAPAPDWIASARVALRSADVVAGRVVRSTGQGDGPQDRLELYYDRLYALRRRIDPLPWEPEPRHHFTGGANLGFRVEAYAALGGFAELASGEDAHIVDEATRRGLRVRRDGATVVETSSRREGRAPAGLASALRAIDLHGEGAIVVAHPEGAVWQYARHAAARSAFAAIDRPETAARLSALIGLTPAHLAGVAADCPNAEAFANRIVPAPPGQPRPTSLAEAEAALAALEGGLQDAAA